MQLFPFAFSLARSRLSLKRFHSFHSRRCTSDGARRRLQKKKKKEGEEEASRRSRKVKLKISMRWLDGDGGGPIKKTPRRKGSRTPCCSSLPSVLFLAGSGKMGQLGRSLISAPLRAGSVVFTKFAEREREEEETKRRREYP